MTTRQAYRIDPGNFKALKISSEPLSPPADHEVQVAVKAIGLNFADVFTVWGLYEAAPKKDFIPGLEYAGEIIAVGKKVTRAAVGDRVMGVIRFGAYTDHLNIDERYVSPLPTDWTYEEGASYLVQGLTAYYALFTLAALEDEQTVLIHSAAGGVGTLATRFAKKKDTYVIGTVSRQDKVAHCLAQGCDEVIVRGDNFGDQLRAVLKDRPLEVVLETNGGKIFKESFDIMAPMGRCVVYSTARYASPSDRPNWLKIAWQFLTRPKIDPQELTTLNKALMGFNLIWLYEKASLMHRLIDEMRDLDIGKPTVGETYSFQELPAALRALQSGKTIGKVVVNV